MANINYLLQHKFKSHLSWGSLMTKITRKMKVACIPQVGCLDAVFVPTCLYNSDLL